MNQAQFVDLWARSAEADAFDAFISHTWATPGYQKFLGCC